MMVELNIVFKLIKEKGYHYGGFTTNNINENLYLDFSTGHNGRGDWIELRLGEEDNDIEYSVPKREKKSSLTNKELIEILEKIKR